MERLGHVRAVSGAAVHRTVVAGDHQGASELIADGQLVGAQGLEFSDDQGRAYAVASCPLDDLLVLHYVPEAV